MNKILFTHSYFYRYDPKQWATKQPYPPLGTTYAASLMRQAGYDVSLFDTNLISSHKEIIPVLEKEKPDYLIIYDDGFNYLTKMCLTNMREAAFEISKYGKKFGAKVIVSSSDSTDHYEKYLDNGADFIILGEAEITLKELVKEIDNENKAFENIKGIAFRENGKTIKTLPRPIMTDLDSLPMPAWDLIDVEEYRNVWQSNRSYFSLNVATTRGCPFKCNWCAKPIYGNRYNSRSPQNVVDEIELLITKYDAKYFWFCDDIFGLKPGWIQEFRDELKRKNLRIKYKIQSRVDLLLKEDTIDALVESGADTVWIGAESGSQRILDAMDKGTTIEQIYKATKLLKQKGIKVAFFLQFGYLGEVKEDINKTISMVKELLPDDIGISVSYPLPGTKFHDKVKEDLKNKTNWTDSDDLAMMFRNTYSPEYYKKLHRYVHKVYRRERGNKYLKSILMNPFKLSKVNLRLALSSFYYIPSIIFDAYKLKKLEST